MENTTFMCWSVCAVNWTDHCICAMHGIITLFRPFLVCQNHWHLAIMVQHSIFIFCSCKSPCQVSTCCAFYSLYFSTYEINDGWKGFHDFSFVCIFKLSILIILEARCDNEIFDHFRGQMSQYFFRLHQLLARKTGITSSLLSAVIAELRPG